MDDMMQLILNDPDISKKFFEMYELLGRKMGFEVAKETNFAKADPNMVRHFLKGFSDAIYESAMIEHEID